MILALQEWGPILVGLLAAVSIVVGARLALHPVRTLEHSLWVTRVFAFGTGAFFVAVCLDFLPDAWASDGQVTPLWIFVGALVMWLATNASDGLWAREESQQTVLESGSAKSLGEDAPSVADDLDSHSALGTNRLRLTPVSAIVLATALSFHTFLEGIAIALAFHPLAWSTLGFSLAMIFHKLPEGVLWGLALATVFTQDRAKVSALLTIPAVCTLLGVMLGIALATHASSEVVRVATGFVAGAMFYIAFAELLPALRESNHPRAARGWFLIGLVLMFILNLAGNFFGG